MFLRNTALYWKFIKKNLGMKRLQCFPRKTTSWACLIRSRLNIIVHWYAQSEILLQLLSISSEETLMSFTIEKIDVSLAKSLNFDIKLLGRSFMYIKNRALLNSASTPTHLHPPPLIPNHLYIPNIFSHPPPLT